MVDFLRANACLKRIVKERKRESWRSYVSSVTVATPVAKVWEKVRKISGLTSSPSTVWSDNRVWSDNTCPYSIEWEWERKPLAVAC